MSDKNLEDYKLEPVCGDETRELQRQIMIEQNKADALAPKCITKKVEGVPLWKTYWDENSELYENTNPEMINFESPEHMRLPIVKVISVIKGSYGSVNVSGKMVENSGVVGSCGAIIPENVPKLLKYCDDHKFKENGLQVIIGEYPDGDTGLYVKKSDLFDPKGDIREADFNTQRTMNYGYGYDFNTHKEQRIYVPYLPSMLLVYGVIRDYEKYSKFLLNHTNIPFMVLEDVTKYTTNPAIKQIVDKSNMYTYHWCLYNRLYSTKPTSEGNLEALLDDI